MTRAEENPSSVRFSTPNYKEENAIDSRINRLLSEIYTESINDSVATDRLHQDR